MRLTPTISVCLLLGGMRSTLSAATFGDFQYVLATGGTEVEISAYTGNADHVAAPETLEGLPLSGASGFGTQWQGKTAVALDPASDQAASAWLMRYGFSYDANLNSDMNGDGIPLLMAYALDLDPTRNLAGRMPQAILGGNKLSMSYFAKADGINYQVQASTDLVDWNTIEVSYSGFDSASRCSAHVDCSGQDRLYLRLSVSE